ncbi:sodium:calcium antiporter [Jannaschia sp. W003]|uniref:sodium:calcium antiporter n=1 Tax=Jannaschia sp. W003 TaxID=2867012 RepID=UPI0021A602D5|nr:sodium:calcium antiporter [Jannaschia sp. W003]UWQ22953.1 sodium:calcium antiporter [Jannaschia sp. W003]
MPDFAALPMLVNLAIIAAGGAAVWWAGTRLAGYADDIARITGMGSAFVGMLLLGGITSLPEIGVSLSAGFGGNADIAVNNLFGSIALQVLVLAIGDWVLGGRALSFMIGHPIVLLQGVFGALLFSVAIAAVSVGDVAVFGAGAWSLGLFVASILFMWFISREESSHPPGWEAKRMPDLGPEADPRDVGLREAVRWTSICAAVILAAGVVVSQAAEAVAEQSGLGGAFIGVTLLGLVTSLPEISTLTAAVRRRRYSMAFGDIFGTNIFDFALIFAVDLAYDGPPVLNEVGVFSQVAAALGVVVTLFYVAGLIERRDETVGRLGIDSWAVVTTYAAGLVLLFFLR